MAHTKEELEAAEEYATIETERYKETHPSKYENDGSKKYFTQCKSDFLAGIYWQKRQPLPLSNLIICPFCGDTDFDKIGLKHHLENYCEHYKTIS